MSAHVAVLFHENYRKYRRRTDYLICHLATCWREAGHRVTFLFGVKTFTPADVLIVHVDLSVVPDEYLDFSRRFAVVINGGVTDVRKSVFSSNLLHAGDKYDGPAIVKSDLNYAGIPERLHSQTRLQTSADHVLSRMPAVRARRSPLRFGTPADYRVYEHVRKVPAAAFRTPGVVVEKFLPEMDQGLYCLRLFHCFGDRTTCVLNRSREPIVRAENKVSRETIEPHPEILAIRRRLKIDYGKLDYAIHDRRVVLFDVNKTPGHGRHLAPHSLERIRQLAAGLSSYVK